MKKIKEPKHFKIALHGGVHMSVVKATCLAQAAQFAKEEYGRSGLDYVQVATEDEVNWFQAMGGSVEEV
jgi:hypothetical protein